MKKGKLGIVSGILIVGVLLNLVFGLDVFGKTWTLMEKLSDTPQQKVTKLSSESAPEIDGSASPWAVPHIKKAYEYGLTYPDIMKDFRKPVIREEFCTIVVKLYERLTLKTEKAGSSPFDDTSNPEIIKAYQLGIVAGTGPKKFSPKANITRQEICVMIFRALEVSVANLNKDTGGNFPFSDQKRIASWALQAMKFAYKNNIMAGVGGGKIDPLSNTTREQAITLIKKTYEAYRSKEIKATVPVGQPEGPKLSEKEKFLKLDFENRLISPKYDTRIELFAATEAGKPAGKPVSSMKAADRNKNRPLQALSLPIINTPVIQQKPNLTVTPPANWLLPRPKGPVWFSAPYAAFIDQSGDKKRWFAFKLKNTQAAKVVWQVSKAPFTGFKDNWKNPRGLVASGQVPASAGEFVIDFASVASGQSKIIPLKLGSGQSIFNKSNYKEIPKNQKKYYVRAVPVDALGNCIGDPGAGLPVLYGKPQTAPAASSQNNNNTFELWSTMFTGSPSGGGPDNLAGSGEFPNKLLHGVKPGYSPESTTPLWFLFHGFDTAATKAVVQVSTKPFTGAADNWESPQGLVYSKPYDKLPVKAVSNFDNCIPIIFSQFGPPKSAMKADEYLPFYVRVVAVKPSNIPGSIEVAFSEVITVNYGFATPIKILTPQNVVVKSYIPTVKFLHYEPIRWESPEWMHKYVVFRAPEWNEINTKFKNVNTNETLYPYANYFLSDPTITPDKYKNEIIPKVLMPGTTVTIVDKQEDKSWWEELWDGIVNFFSSIYEIVKGITNWVSNAYNSLKSGLINLVANYLPLVPDEWRDELKISLEALVNTGLAAMGIPPTLPNFDQLTSMSLDYMAEVALTEAGIPANEITKEMVEQTAKGIGSEIAKSANTAGPNPINSPFLKNHPDYLYRPAYIEVELSNPYDKPSLPGSLGTDVEWEWRENVQLDHTVWSQLPASEQYADALKYLLHFLYGLSRGHNGYPIYYPVFHPVRGQPIPSLQPGEKRVVRIYMQEFAGDKYPFAVNGEYVEWEDFAHLYWGDVGKARFSVGTRDYNLPDVKEEAKKQGFVADSDHIYTFSYDRTSSGTSFEQIPSQAY